MKLAKVWLLAAGVLLAGCSDPDPVWIVVDFKRPDGTNGQMAFNNPAVPDMTLEDCKGSLQDALPTLMQGIENQPQTKGSVFLNATCIQSAEDPIKPKS